MSKYKVKVCVDITLKDVPRNVIWVDIPDEYNKEYDETCSSAKMDKYAEDFVYHMIDNGDIEIKAKDTDYIIPKELIKYVNIYSDDLV